MASKKFINNLVESLKIFFEKELELGKKYQEAWLSLSSLSGFATNKNLYVLHVTLEPGETDRFGEIAYLVEKIFKTMAHEHYVAIWRVSVHDYDDSFCCEQDDYPLFCIEPVEEKET